MSVCGREGAGSDENLYECTIFESETIHRSAGSIENPEAEKKGKSANYAKQVHSKPQVVDLLQDLSGQLTSNSLLALASALQDVAPKIAAYKPRNNGANVKMFDQTRKKAARLCEELVRHVNWLAKESSQVLDSGCAVEDMDAVGYASQPATHSSLPVSRAVSLTPIPISSTAVFKKPVLMPVPRSIKVTASPPIAAAASSAHNTHQLLLPFQEDDDSFKDVFTPATFTRSSVSSSAPAASSRKHFITSESEADPAGSESADVDDSDEDDSSLESAEMSMRRSTRTTVSRQPVYKFDQNKPYRSFDWKIGDTQYTFTLCGEILGTVSVKPGTIAKEHSPFVAFCFCHKRNFIRQADYIYCEKGVSCNHLVHKHCIRNFGFIREADYPSRLSHYTCHMCADEAKPVQERSISTAILPAVPARSDSSSEDFWKEDDEEPGLLEMYEAEEKPETRKAEQVKSRKSTEEEERLVKKARYQQQYNGGRAQPKDHEVPRIAYMPNGLYESATNDHIMTIGIEEKVYYVYLYHRVGSTTYGCFGFPEILPVKIPRLWQSQLKKDLCFCNDLDSSRNWYQNYYVFCKDGSTCNHLVHRNCLRAYHTKKEREYPTVFNLHFVCDGCQRLQESEDRF